MLINSFYVMAFYQYLASANWAQDKFKKSKYLINLAVIFPGYSEFYSL